MRLLTGLMLLTITGCAQSVGPGSNRDAAVDVRPGVSALSADERALVGRWRRVIMSGAQDVRYELEFRSDRTATFTVSALEFSGRCTGEVQRGEHTWQLERDLLRAPFTAGTCETVASTASCAVALPEFARAACGNETYARRAEDSGVDTLFLGQTTDTLNLYGLYTRVR
jgi:hypothetical protein